jgi:hypothetical protein
MDNMKIIFILLLLTSTLTREGARNYKMNPVFMNFKVNLDDSVIVAGYEITFKSLTDCRIFYGLSEGKKILQSDFLTCQVNYKKDSRVGDEEMNVYVTLSFII